MSTFVNELYDAVQKRPRPEDVAEIVLRALGPTVTKAEKVVLNKAAQHSLKARVNQYTSMATDFARPVSAQRQVNSAQAVFGIAPSEAVDAADRDDVERYIRELGVLIRKDFGSRQKLNAEARKAAGIFKTTRWYNRRFRALVNLEEKISRLVKNEQKYRFARVSKSAGAIDITLSDMERDLNTSCFIAYMSARMSMRSEFTVNSQVKPFDEVAEVLLQRCERHADTTAWDLIALLMPDARVINHLNDEQKGTLLGKWWNLMSEMANVLRDLARDGNINLETMIVQKGNDSTTWNQVAGAWNKAREQWISLLHSLKYEAILDSLCPGKVMRLMAADVAAYHRMTGNAEHPDTKVFVSLPNPWEVLNGTATCTKQFVELACANAGANVDNWVKGRTGREAEAFAPTPELVHGVTVSSPTLASALKKAGAFSGKSMKHVDLPEFQTIKDEHGFVIQAYPGQ
jgi:hypothetical protein